MNSLKIVKNDLFDYKNRYIFQLEKGFKFSIDAILLSEYVSVGNSRCILDMCTGNAPIPLILSLKTEANIVGFEIQELIADLAKKSIDFNKLDEKIKIINDDIKNIGNYYNHEYFDIITCNPPYFKTKSDGYKNKLEVLTIARHEVTINLEDIFALAFKYLKNNGVFYLVHRVERLDDIIYLGRTNRLNVKEIQLVQTKKGDAPSIVLVKCVKNSKSGIKLRDVKCIDNLTTYQHLFD